MDDLKWLDEYSGQSTDELLELENEYRTDSLLLAFEQALYHKLSRMKVGNLTKEETVILAVEALEREVNNGGYDQFFRNASNKFTSIIVGALREIGCREAADLTREAINALEIPGSLIPETIEQVMKSDNEERDKKLSECDSKYYEVVGDLSRPLLDYIRRNKAQIQLEP